MNMREVQDTAVREPMRISPVVDELGELTFSELHDRSNRLADALRSRGVSAGDGIAVMCRNHRGFVDTSIAAAKLGADILYLNTAFAGPQLVDVLDRESPKVVVHDEEFSELHGARLVLVSATRTVFQNGLDLLGVTAPERM